MPTLLFLAAVREYLALEAEKHGMVAMFSDQKAYEEWVDDLAYRLASMLETT